LFFDDWGLGVYISFWNDIAFVIVNGRQVASGFFGPFYGIDFAQAFDLVFRVSVECQAIAE